MYSLKHPFEPCFVVQPGEIVRKTCLPRLREQGSQAGTDQEKYPFEQSDQDKHSEFSEERSSESRRNGGAGLTPKDKAAFERKT